MRKADPIASPTLARLYMSQGHWARARGMLEQLVERDPYDGDALALLARLGAQSGRLTVRRDGNDLHFRWHAIATHPAVSLVAVTTRAEGPGGLRVGVTSVPCTEPFGELRFALPSEHGAVAASIGRVVPGSGYVPSVVVPAFNW